MNTEQKSVLIALVAAAGIGAFVLLHKRSTVPTTDATQPTTAPPSSPLDAGLTSTEVHAVNTALAVETNPANLHAFAAAMTPDFPIAASLLNSRAVALTGR